MNGCTSPDQSPLKLSVCECGNINVTYKSVTFHFTREEFHQYAIAITQFLGQLRMTPSLHPTFSDDQSLKLHPSLDMNKHHIE